MYEKYLVDDGTRNFQILTSLTVKYPFEVNLYETVEPNGEPRFALENDVLVHLPTIKLTGDVA